MGRLVIIALVSIAAVSAFASPPSGPTPNWAHTGSVTIPVIKDVTPVASTPPSGPAPNWNHTGLATISPETDAMPVASIDLNGSVIKLVLSGESSALDIMYEGVADPMPQLYSNIRVGITASIVALDPSIENVTYPFTVALRNEPFTPSVSPVSGIVLYGPLADGHSSGIEVAVEITNPDLTAMAPGTDVPVALVTLTVTPAP